MKGSYWHLLYVALFTPSSPFPLRGGVASTPSRSRPHTDHFRQARHRRPRGVSALARMQPGRGYLLENASAHHEADGSKRPFPLSSTERELTNLYPPGLCCCPGPPTPLGAQSRR